jgi:thiol-disulfide isomerase/thioredoxin
MNKKHLAAYVLVALGFSVLGAAVGLRQDATAAATASAPATDLYAQQLNDLAGKPQPLAKWKGKPLLVNFWASWCAPCVREMPELSTLAAKDGGKRFNVIGIGIDSPTNLAEFTRKVKIAYPIYVGGMGGTDLARALGNANGGLPFTVLLDAEGRVRKTYLGSLKFDQLTADLAKL